MDLLIKATALHRTLIEGALWNLSTGINELTTAQRGALRAENMGGLLGERRKRPTDFSVELIGDPMAHSKLLSEFRNAQSAEDGSRGAFVIPSGDLLGPTEFALDAFSPIRQNARVIRTDMGSNHALAFADDSSQEGYVHRENQTRTTAADISFSRAVFLPDTFDSGTLRIPNELSQDQPSTLSDIGMALGRRVARIQNSTWTNILQLTLPSVTAGSAGSISRQDINSLLDAVGSSYQESPSLALMAHPSVIRTILGLADSNGGLMFPSGRPFGVRLVRNKHLSSVLTSGSVSVIVGDLSQVVIADHRVMRIKVYREAVGTAENDATDVGATQRSAMAVLAFGTEQPLVRLVHP